MALIPWLEKNVHGDGNVAKDMRNLGLQGAGAFRSGTAISDEGIGGVRRLGDAYETMLKSGRSVLPDSTQSVLKRARGAISDRNVRDTMASAARLKQARVASGGRLSAEAAQEYLTEAESEANRAAQEADLGLSSQEAEMELSETNNLRDRLARAREVVLGAGQERMALGQAGQIAALGLRNDRHKAIAGTIASFF